MANRYLRATGNWNGAVWAATSDGAAGSASAPTANDDVYLSGTLVVTLVADAECRSISLAPGPPPFDHGPRIDVGSHSLHVHGDVNFYGQITGAGSIIVDGDFSVNSITPAYPDLIILNTSASTTFETHGNAYNDVRINMSGTNETLTITGSPTFRSLISQSKNSAAHTVEFEDSPAGISIDKLIAIGSGVSNRLSIVREGEFGGVLSIRESCYGQYVDMQARGFDTFAPLYIGANSIDSSGTDWLLQDPPKISTLVDPLTTAPGSNSNWSLEDGAIQATSGLGGGGYESVGSNDVTMISTGTYDLVDSGIIYQIKAENNGTNQAIAAVQWAFMSGVRPGAFAFISGDNGGAIVGNYNPNPHDYEDGVDVGSGTVDTSNYLFVRISCSSSTGAMKTELSEGGVDWIVSAEIVLDDFELDMLRSTRIYATAFSEYGEAIIGSINMLPAPTSTGNFLPFFIP